MSKVIIIQERGRHEGNREFRESCCLKRSFNALGHECTIWGKGHENFHQVPDFDQFDLVINHENYGDEWLPDMSKWNKPFKVLWCIDAHVRGTDPYEWIFHRGKYDILAHSTNAYVKDRHHVWLPNCTDASLIKPIPVSKTHRIGFCGNHVTSQRKQAVDILSQVFKLKQDIWVIGEDMVRAINSYHIHFNMNIGIDINYRSFETLACGTVLVTNFNPEYVELGFVDGVNCFMYSSDTADMIKVVTKAIAMIGSPEFKEIGDAGRRLFLDRHTYDIRAEQIMRLSNERR
jgi:hypothetical protein